MNTQEIVNKLWNDYSELNPSAKKIHTLFSNEEESIQNDHIAFRTFNDSRIATEVLARIFINAGYVEKNTYTFKEKKLTAKHYEHCTEINAPKIFISELILEEFSSSLQNTIKDCLSKIPNRIIHSDHLIFSGSSWGIPSYQTYQNLRAESEYAAWLYVYGFRANHFTVLANTLKKYNELKKLNSFLKQNGFLLNNSGMEIKGSPDQFLEQSSTMADIIKVNFVEGMYEIPACYYEFAKRYCIIDGSLYNGFLAMSADKIFESTNFYTL